MGYRLCLGLPTPAWTLPTNNPPPLPPPTKIHEVSKLRLPLLMEHSEAFCSCTVMGVELHDITQTHTSVLIRA